METTMKVQSFIKFSILSASSLLLLGCSPKEVIVVQYKFVQQSIPEPAPKPEFKPYEFMEVEFNNKKYFALDKEQATLLGVNWIVYKEFAETNFKILDTLHKNSLENQKPK